MMLATLITRELGALLTTCTAANGFPSNVGAQVFLGQIQGRAEDAPAIWVVPGPQRETQRYGPIVELARDYSIRAFADLRDGAAWAGGDRAARNLLEVELVDEIIFDIVRCLDTWDLADSPLIGLVDQIRRNGDRPGYSEDGGTRVGCAVDITVTYRVDFSDPTQSAL